MSTILPLQNPPRIRGGFETIVAPLIGRDGEELDQSEWIRGITGQTLASPAFFSSQVTGGSWGDPDDGDLKPSSLMGDDVTFRPSSVGSIFECEMNEQTARGNVVLDNARNSLDRHLWSLVAQHIHNVGTAIDCMDGAPINPTLRGSAILPDGYDDESAGSIRGVLQGLLDAVCGAPMGTDPVFLVPRAFMPHFLGDVARWDEASETFRFGPHRIAFDCIENLGPDGTTTAGDGTEAWVYMMIAPQVAVADSGEGDVVAVRTHLQNVHRVRAERQFAYWFDQSLVYAAKANINRCIS